MGAGRPKLELNDEGVEHLASFMCTNEEIAAVLNCSADTIERNYAGAVKKGHERGKSSLRRQQYKMAMGVLAVGPDGKPEEDKNGNPTNRYLIAPNPTLLIWLGKQCLHQSDKNENKPVVPEVGRSKSSGRRHPASLRKNSTISR